MASDDKKRELEEYFSEIIEGLEIEFKKSEEYSKKIDAEIEKFGNTMASRGTQLFLTEHIRNAIALQSQRQSLIKDKFTIKKAILDYTAKDKNAETASKSLFEELSKLINQDKTKIIEEKHAVNQEDLDKQIDELLENSEEE